MHQVHLLPWMHIIDERQADIILEYLTTYGSGPTLDRRLTGRVKSHWKIAWFLG